MNKRRGMSPADVRRMCITAMFMALCALAGVYALPVGAAHIYLTDVFVCIAALLLPPSVSWIAGGIGAFLGDVLFYPPAMFVTLITRTVQSLLISYFANDTFRKHPFISDALAVTVGAVVMVCGYFSGHMLMYGPAETTFISYVIPQIVQAVFGAAVSIICVHSFHLRNRMKKAAV